MHLGAWRSASSALGMERRGSASLTGERPKGGAMLLRSLATSARTEEPAPTPTTFDRRAGLDPIGWKAVPERVKRTWAVSSRGPAAGAERSAESLKVQRLL